MVLPEAGFVPEIHNIQDFCLDANAFSERVQCLMIGFIEKSVVLSFLPAGVFAENMPG